mgnify:CR=1 FL=1
MLKFVVPILIALSFPLEVLSGQFGLEVGETVKSIRKKGELLLMSGIQLTKVRDPDETNGLSPTPATLPFRVYVNIQTKTFTVIETHPSYASSCILAFGENFSSILLDTM